MQRSRILPYLLALSATLALRARAQDTLNLSFEQVSPDGKTPRGWSLSFVAGQQESHELALDSIVRKDGRYALSIRRKSPGADYAAAEYVIPVNYQGRQLVLTGYLRTENVRQGYAGLWMRIDAEDRMINLDVMQNRGVTGTTEWTAYKISLPYSTPDAHTVHIGGLLTGEGRMWIDQLSLSLDGKPLHEAPVRKVQLLRAQTDTGFRKGSGITNSKVSVQQQQWLSDLGQVWGFVKYHHPAVAKGNHNMDAELFRFLPGLLQARDNAQAYQRIEAWVDGFGIPDSCLTCTPVRPSGNVKLMPDYGQLFTASHLPASLQARLQRLLNNRNQGRHYYIDMFPQVGNPQFTHEETYRRLTSPDAGMRLLALYRYWNMIQYFFPYRHLIGEDWTEVLHESVPVFLGADNDTSYAVACLRLIARVHDTHANIWGLTPALSAWRGRFHAPLQAKFVEGKLVITGYYRDKEALQQFFAPGDIIAAINGVSIDTLVARQLPFTPASNHDTRLRDLPDYLLRSRDSIMDIKTIHNGKAQSKNITLFPSAMINRSIDYDPAPGDRSFKVIEGDIGYVNPGKYRNNQLDTIRKAFAGTRGMIIDMRTYPSEFMPFTFGAWIKPEPAPFAMFTQGSVANPGLFSFTPVVSNGTQNGKKYAGPIVIIVDASTQSQAEYTTMAFQGFPNVTVIGSTTAAADGNISEINLPGAINTLISGIGVYYPDGTETQRVGVKIDEEVRPTIAGIRAGRDELLERAIAILRKKTSGTVR